MYPSQTEVKGTLYCVSVSDRDQRYNLMWSVPDRDKGTIPCVYSNNTERKGTIYCEPYKTELKGIFDCVYPSNTELTGTIYCDPSKTELKGIFHCLQNRTKSKGTHSMYPSNTEIKGPFALYSSYTDFKGAFQCVPNRTKVKGTLSCIQPKQHRNKGSCVSIPNRGWRDLFLCFRATQS